MVVVGLALLLCGVLVNLLHGAPSDSEDCLSGGVLTAEDVCNGTSEDDCSLSMLQRQGRKLAQDREQEMLVAVASVNKTVEKDYLLYKPGRETGSFCFVYHCQKELGPTTCHHFRCICQEGYMWSGLTRRCEAKGSTPIQRQTDGTCWIWPCSSWRGPTICRSHKCWCQEGYTSVNGVCERVKEVVTTTTTTTAPGSSLLPAFKPPPAMQTSCAHKGEQCGGVAWTGSTCCEAGCTCQEQSSVASLCMEVRETTQILKYGFAADLRASSTATLKTFYMYRAQGKTSYPPENVNMANLDGVMWYLHNEIVGRPDWFYKRKFDITRIIRYKVQTKATQPLIDRGMNFGVRFAFDSGQCTGPWSCDSVWQNYGYIVGCNKFSSQFPFPNFPVSYDGIWYSLPGKCPQMRYFQKSNKSEGSVGPQCLSTQPGGYCIEPTGTADCTWTYEEAGEINLDELVGIPGDHDEWLSHGNREYDKLSDHGTGLSFWDKINDRVRSAKRVAAAKALFEKYYPGSYDMEGLSEATCDFDQNSFYKKAPGGYRDIGKEAANQKCHTAMPGERCHEDIRWAKTSGIYGHPTWYPGLTPKSSDIQFQIALHKAGKAQCPQPCD